MSDPLKQLKALLRDDRGKSWIFRSIYREGKYVVLLVQHYYQTCGQEYEDESESEMDWDESSIDECDDEEDDESYEQDFRYRIDSKGCVKFRNGRQSVADELQELLQANGKLLRRVFAHKDY